MGKEISLDKNQSQNLYNTIVNLKEKAKVGEVYKKDLKNEVLKLSALFEPNMANVMKGVIEKLSIEELKSFRDSYKA